MLKEIMDPVGGKIEIRDIVCGDDTMSVLELWGAEYQVCPRPMGGLRGFRSPGNPQDAGAILSSKTALKSIS